MGFICLGRREFDAACSMGLRVAAAGNPASFRGRPATCPGDPVTGPRPAGPWREPRAWAPHPGPVSPPLPRPLRSSSSSSPPSAADAAPVATRLRSFTSAQELLAVQRTVAALTESGFYWGAVGGPEARRLLAEQPVGTFLVRDSTDPRHLFSLTLRTRLGATSVRVQLHAGRFRLECSARRDALPGFDCVLKLLEHYVRPPREPSAYGGETEAPPAVRRALPPVDGRSRMGAVETAEKRRARAQQQQRTEEAATAGVEEKGRTPLLLTRPLRHARVASLQHLARKAVHRALQGRLAEQLQLPSLLQGYLETYPYQL